MVVNPCKDCAGRHTACSDHCDKYTKFKKEHRNQKKWLKENNQSTYFFYCSCSHPPKK